jgi:Pyruvate/2-oxoacid:ferredoxin oxidoreductase gamma subunit/GNAT superfamily N-acetyltransferase
MLVRKAEPQDCHTVNRLMELLIEEIYARETDEVRRVLKANFTNEALTEMCAEDQARLFVVEDEGQVIAFIYGWLFQHVFSVYWIYCLKPYRGKGAVRKLFAFAENEAVCEGVTKVEMWVHAEHNKFLDFCGKLGFQKGILIEQSMFGVKIQNIYKYVGPHGVVDLEKKIKILGEAGQGVKLLSFTLASILARLGHEVSLNLEYDSAVRSGKISADLIYSDVKIENPIIDEADILIKFTKNRDWFPAKALVIDESICEDGAIECSVKSSHGTYYGFENVALSLFGSKVYINMIALGRILRYIGINILLLNIRDLLPPKFIEKNMEAIKYGFRYRD